MKKTIQKVKARIAGNGLKRALLGISVFASLFATVATAAPAAAASCVWTNTGSYGGPSYTWDQTTGGHDYYYSSQMRVPYNSGCHDINITNISSAYPGYCAIFRVRFYPSSGGSYTNNWRQICGNNTAATWVNDGTLFRVETLDVSVNFSVFD